MVLSEPSSGQCESSVSGAVARAGCCHDGDRSDSIFQQNELAGAYVSAGVVIGSTALSGSQ